MRKTKIVCTIGPSSSSEIALTKLARAGMNVARINMSHGTEAEHKEVISNIKKVRERLELPIGILVDLKGPEIRIGKFETGSAKLKNGQDFVLEYGKFLGDDKHVSVSSELLAKYVERKQRLLLSDGEIELEVVKKQDGKIVCKVKNGGTLSNNKSINVPGVKIPLVFLSAADKKDILLAISQEADFLALSFVESKKDVQEVRNFLKKNGGAGIKIISKIESAIGIANMQEIVLASDGVMVARGDMGVEVDFKNLPHIQKRLIALCRENNKFVITATQMLESMITNARPTRAEVTDIANAVLDGTDAVMLSGETAIGVHPDKCVKVMAEIAETSEQSILYANDFKNKLNGHMEVDECVCYAAVASSFAISAKTILAVTNSGKTAKEISCCRPQSTIVACTPNQKTYFEMSILFGVVPLLCGVQKGMEGLLKEAEKTAKLAKMIKQKDVVVETVGVPIGHKTNIVRIQEIE